MSFRMPQEHGAWGILLVPFLCSAAVAAACNVPLLLCGAALLSLFLLRGSLAERGRGRGTSDGNGNLGKELLAPAHLLMISVGGGASLLLVFSYRRYQLFWLGLAAAALFLFQQWLAQVHQQQNSEKRSLAAELVGVVLLTLGAPAAWIAARGSVFDNPPSLAWGRATSLEVWLLNLLFFLGGILYVKYRVRGLLAHRHFGSLRERFVFAWPVFLYHFLLLAFLACWGAVNLLSSAGHAVAPRAVALSLAFAPGILRANRLLFQLGERFPIRRLGWNEILHASVFAGLLILAFRLPG